jgi:hypothetical protein
LACASDQATGTLVSSGPAGATAMPLGVKSAGLGPGLEGLEQSALEHGAPPAKGVAVPPSAAADMQDNLVDRGLGPLECGEVAALARWQELVCEGGDSDRSDRSRDGEALLIDVPSPAEGPAAGDGVPSPGSLKESTGLGKRARSPSPGATAAAAPAPKRSGPRSEPPRPIDAGSPRPERSKPFP